MRCGYAQAFPEQDDSLCQTLLVRAETALHKAREQPLRLVSFERDLMSEQSRHLEIGRHLTQAAVFAEFKNQYQPQVSMSDGRISGVEVLIRWQSPSLGRVPPSSFIDIARRLNLLSKIDLAVLVRTLEFGRSLPQSAIPLSVAVNVCPDCLLDSTHSGALLSFAERVPKGVQMEVEITENALLPLESSLLDTLYALHERGVTLALDDFGSGYSNLGYLAKFPFRRLKLDRSLTQNIPNSDRMAQLAKATIHMAQDLGLEVVAEGIELAEQADFFGQLGCDYAQGYFYSPPLDMRGVSQIYSNHKQQQQYAKHQAINNKGQHAQRLDGFHKEVNAGECRDSRDQGGKRN